MKLAAIVKTILPSTTRSVPATAPPPVEAKRAVKAAKPAAAPAVTL